VAGNPVGAGDAVAAGLVHGLVTGRPWEERLRHAVALGSAAVAAPAAGEFRPEDYEAALAGVVVTQEADG
jgi:tagatose 6-phosphate kinase